MHAYVNDLFTLVLYMCTEGKLSSFVRKYSTLVDKQGEIHTNLNLLRENCGIFSFPVHKSGLKWGVYLLTRCRGGAEHISCDSWVQGGGTH